MSDSNNYDALFSPQIDMGDQNKKNSEEYQVGADKGQGGVYEALIRFIPWWKNPTNSISEKWVSWLVDPITGKGRFVDCPSSVGKPSLLQDMYWKLKKSESVQEQKKAEIFSRRHQFATLIQVVRDKNQPELEGKILVYRFGKKLWEKINAELKPIIGEVHNPFDLLNGKLFHLKITKVSGFNNYDQSRFLDKVIPLLIPNAEGKLEPISEATDKAAVFNFLKENSPDLDKYGFKEWDQETYNYVNGVIAAVTGSPAPSTMMADVNDQVHSDTPVQQPPKEESTGISTSDLSLDELTKDSGLPNTDLPSIDLPDLPDSGGLSGSLDDVLEGL